MLRPFAPAAIRTSLILDVDLKLNLNTDARVHGESIKHIRYIDIDALAYLPRHPPRAQPRNHANMRREDDGCFNAPDECHIQSGFHMLGLGGASRSGVIRGCFRRNFRRKPANKRNAGRASDTDPTRGR